MITSFSSRMLDPITKIHQSRVGSPQFASFGSLSYPILSFCILHCISKKKKRRENAMKYTRLWESNLSIRHLVNADNKSRALRKLRKEEKKNYACCLELYVLHPNGRKGG